MVICMGQSLQTPLGIARHRGEDAQELPGFSLILQAEVGLQEVKGP